MEWERPEPPHSTEKWHLENGGTVYAPQHPLHLHVPGFWDEVEVGGKKYSKLLCVSFLVEAEGELIELDPYLSYWYWYPDRIEARYYLVRREGIGYKQQAGVRVFLEEQRWIAADGSLNCRFTFDLLKQHPQDLHVVAWGEGVKVRAEGGLPSTESGSARVNGPVVPKLRQTPFFEMVQAGRMQDVDGEGEHKLSALHWRVPLAEGEPVAVQVQAAPDLD